ncbi:hypothetical protein AWC38_SpisGene23745 [Stylophora pistillata]|uniref:YqaJ viral recombinase domain-containing protein n=1 Tax=Stylophora pistillata TaxID=50429 RepID=A0A2B4R763_STYPI|nr:hypothetical protein AWC38_SpisGene23745 [Stylophora pistillata]
MAARGTTKRGFLPGYFEGLQLKDAKEMYLEKLKDIDGEDPYKIPRNEWIYDVDSWPNVTCIHVGMYLLFKKSPYTEDQLMNYKSLDCYQNFANGWVREILSKKFGENRLLIAKSLTPDLPDVLSNLYDESLANADYPTLLEKANEIVEEIQVTKKQQALVEERTRDQADSRLWFRMRTGRIRASKFKNACRTDPSCPSHSLIMSICHPEMARFNTEATKWGCQHEKVAKETYASFQKVKHKNFGMSYSGLFVSRNHPYLGASPDGLVCCDCCGAGVCVIKCPFCHKNDHISTSAQDKNFCFEVTTTGAHRLKRNHQYYYQVQLQLMCTDLKYIDFVVWTKNGLFIERIFADKSFREEKVPKAKEFFLCEQIYVRLLADGTRDQSHLRQMGLLQWKGGMLMNFFIVGVRNMGKWLDVMMEGAAIGCFTWNV